MRDPEIFLEFADSARLNTYYRGGNDLPGALAIAERQSKLFLDIANGEVARSRGVGALLIGLVGAATGLAIVNTGGAELFTVLGLSGAALRIGNELTFDEDRRKLLERYAHVTQCHLETHRPYLITLAARADYTASSDELVRAVDEVRAKSASLLATRDASRETKDLLEGAILKVDAADQSFGKLDLYLARTNSAGEHLRDRLRETLIDASTDINKEDAISPDQVATAAGRFASLATSTLSFDVSDITKRIGELSPPTIAAGAAPTSSPAGVPASSAALILAREGLRQAVARLESARRDVARAIAVIDDDFLRARQKRECHELAATDFTVVPTDRKITLKTGESATIVVSGVSAAPKAEIGVQTVSDALTLEPQQARDNAYPFKVSFKATVKQKATSRVTFTDEASGQSVTKEIVLDYKAPQSPAPEKGHTADSEEVVSNKAFVQSTQQYLIRKLQPAPTLIVTGALNKQMRDALERYQNTKTGLDDELRALGEKTAAALSSDIIASAQNKENIFPVEGETTDKETICKAERQLKENYDDIDFVVIDGELAGNERGLVFQFQYSREKSIPGSFQYLTAALDPGTLGYLRIVDVKEGCPSS